MRYLFLPVFIFVISFIIYLAVKSFIKFKIREQIPLWYLRDWQMILAANQDDPREPSQDEERTIMEFTSSRYVRWLGVYDYTNSGRSEIEIYNSSDRLFDMDTHYRHFTPNLNTFTLSQLFAFNKQQWREMYWGDRMEIFDLETAIPWTWTPVPLAPVINRQRVTRDDTLRNRYNYDPLVEHFSNPTPETRQHAVEFWERVPRATNVDRSDTRPSDIDEDW